MKNMLCKKSISYAVLFLIIAVGFFPSLTPLSTATIPKNITIKNPLKILPSDDTEYWALLVAVGVYAENPEQNRPDMLLEVDDLYSLLLESDWWSEDHIKVIKGEDATVLNIIAGLRWLDRMEDNNDISVVFFSTHGFPLGVDIPPKDEADETDEALVSYWGFAFENLFIWDDELNVLLNRLESKGVCLIIDSCYAGGFNDPPNWNITTIPPLQSIRRETTAADWIRGFGEEVRGQNRVVIMASCEDEVSFSGGFAPYLIDGLRGYGDTNSDTIISAEEAFYYAQPRSPRQNPTIYDGYAGDLPIMNLATPAQIVQKEQLTQRNQETENDIIEHVDKSAETSTLCGYIQSANTSSPIENAVVEVRGRINGYEWYENQTTTDATGFFLMNTPAIRLRVTANADGYLEQSIGSIQMYENETRWVNLSLYERPPETASICGYITDENTTNPLEMANVSLFWQVSEQQYYQNNTTSDVAGFYQMNVAAGNISLQMEKEGYFSEDIEDISIGDLQTIWVNISLCPRPTENAVICGYITDKETGEPLNGTRIEFEWVDIDLDHDYRKETQTNASGYFSILIAPGEVYIDIREQDYDFYDPYRHDGIENSNVWLNYSLSHSHVEVEIAKPLKALYRNNERIIPLSKTRIIGAIDIEAYIPWDWHEPGSGSVERVEFYIDGEWQATITTQPYTWSWTQATFGKHLIKIIAYDFNGDSTSKEIEVWKYF